MVGYEIGKKYVALIKEDKHEECLRELFSKDAVSIEPFAPPGQDREARGVDAIVAKGKWWTDNHDVHRVELSGPFPNGDRFAVRFFYEVTNKPSGKRFTIDEVGLFTVENGKIAREEFFYPPM